MNLSRLNVGGSRGSKTGVAKGSPFHSAASEPPNDVKIMFASSKGSTRAKPIASPAYVPRSLSAGERFALSCLRYSRLSYLCFGVTTRLRGIRLGSFLEEGENHCLTDRKSTRLNSSHANISYAVFCLKK